MTLPDPSRVPGSASFAEMLGLAVLFWPVLWPILAPFVIVIIVLCNGGHL